MTDRTYIVEYWTGSEDEKADLAVTAFGTAEEALSFIKNVRNIDEDLHEEDDIHFQITILYAPIDLLGDDFQNWIEWEEQGLIDHDHECMTVEELIASTQDGEKSLQEQLEEQLEEYLITLDTEVSEAFYRFEQKLGVDGIHTFDRKKAALAKYAPFKDMIAEYFNDATSCFFYDKYFDDEEEE